MFFWGFLSFSFFFLFFSYLAVIITVLLQFANSLAESAVVVVVFSCFSLLGEVDANRLLTICLCRLYFCLMLVMGFQSCSERHRQKKEKTVWLVN